MIVFDRVSLSYRNNRHSGGLAALRNLSFEITRGELLVLLGPSGCGKTTTLKLINRLLEPSSGQVSIDGVGVERQDPIALRRRVGYVFQRFGLFPHMTLGENVAVVPELLKWPAADIEERSDALLQLLGLPPDEYRGRYPSELSGGQQQRVGVARALAAKPEILLMDEPFGALDPVSRDRLQQEYQRIHAELGLTTVLVTHDVTEALLLADRIAVMEAGQLVQLGTPSELLEAPSCSTVRDLMQTPRRQLERLSQLTHASSSSTRSERPS